MPVYNHEMYVQDAIRSLVRQTYAHMELIVINDGSTDSSWQKIQEMRAECEARFVRTCFVSKENEGTCVTLNKLLQRAHGKYVYLIASDDLAKPHAIATETAFLEQHPDYCLVVGDNEFIDGDGQRIYWDNERNPVQREQEICYRSFGQFFRQTRKDVDFLSDEFGSYASLYFRNYITNGYTMRKATLDLIGPIPELGVFEDYYLMLQLAKYGKFKYIDEILFSYRWHSTNSMKDFAVVDMHDANTRAVEELILKDRKLHPRRDFTPEFARWLDSYDPGYPHAALSVRDPAHLRDGGGRANGQARAACVVEQDPGRGLLYKARNTNPAYPAEAYACCVRNAVPTFSKKRLAIFACHDVGARVDDTVLYQLRGLLAVADAVVFVADNPILLPELEKLAPLAAYVSCCEHGGSGFGAYKAGVLHAETQGYLEQVDALILCDDSCLGPVTPLEPLFAAMDACPCDFWSLLDTPGRQSSSFFVVRRPILRDSAFARHFRQCDAQGCVSSPGQRAKELPELLGQWGYCGNARFRRRELAAHVRCLWRSGNPDMMLWPRTLLEYGVPLVRLLARDGGFVTDLQENPWDVLAAVQERNPELGALVEARCTRDIPPGDAHWLTPDRLLSQYDVVFFNVFETLLESSLSWPRDALIWMEERTGRVGFAAQRMLAEEQARAAAGGEVSLATIYANAALRDHADMQEQELALTGALYSANTRVKPYYDLAVRLGKRIALLADSCLPAEAVRTLLRRAGYVDFEALFVSGETGLTRASGGLFRHALRVLGATPEQTVHIGSRWAQDRDTPTALGIRAHIVDPRIWAFRHHVTHYKYWLFHRRVNSRLSGMLLTLWADFAQRQQDADPFYAWGYCFGGPFALGFCQFIRQCCAEEGIDALVFAGPAGPLLQRAFATLGGGLSCQTAPHFHEALWDPLPVNTTDGDTACRVAAGLPLHTGAEAPLTPPPLEVAAARVALVQISTANGALWQAARRQWGELLHMGIVAAWHRAAASAPVRSYAGGAGTPKERVFLCFVEELLGETAFADTLCGAVAQRSATRQQLQAGAERFVADFVATYGDACPALTYADYRELVQALRDQCTPADALVLRQLFRPGAANPLACISLMELLAPAVA